MITPANKALEFYNTYGEIALDAFVEMKSFFERVDYNAIPEYWTQVEHELCILLN